MAHTLLLSLLVVLFSIASCAPMTCPNIEVLKPCTCKRVAYGLQIVCANFKSGEALERAFNILRDYNVHTVLLHNLFIDETLPSNLFDGLTIKEIKVERCRLRFDQPAFKGLDSSLYVLNIAQHSMIKYNDSFALAKLTKLNELNVQSNHLEQVSDAWLTDRVPNVNTVILDYNDIALIQDHAFAGLGVLKQLSLADNKIKTVKRSMLPYPAYHLTRIDLSFNSISSFPRDFFEAMPNLKEIVLSGNELRTLDENIWSPVWSNLDQLLLFDNRIECTDEMNWIRSNRQPHQLEGQCVTPKQVAGHPIKDVYAAT